MVVADYNVSAGSQTQVSRANFAECVASTLVDYTEIFDRDTGAVWLSESNRR